MRWAFFHREHLDSTIPWAKLTPETYERMTGKWSEKFFGDELLRFYGFHADPESISLWKPNAKYSKVPDEWKHQDMPDVQETSTYISPYQSLSQAIQADVSDNSLNIQLLVTANSMIPVPWFFLNAEHSNSNIQIIYLAPSTLKQNAIGVRTIFSEALKTCYNFIADAGTVSLYKPHAAVSMIPVEWMKAHTSVNDIADYVFPSTPIESVITKKGNNPETLNLLVVAQGHYQIPQTGIVESKTSHLLEFERYNSIVQASSRLPPPSEGANHKVYNRTQARRSQAIFDGRYPSRHETSLIAPTIQIYHPIFARFQQVLEDPQVQPTATDMLNTRKFMNFLGEIGSAHEDVCNAKFRDYIFLLIGEEALSIVNSDRTVPDGSFWIRVDNQAMVYACIELKKELGASRGDPSIQAALSMRNNWLLCDVIVQRLTGLTWMALSSTVEDRHIYHCARIIVAIRKTIQELKSYYMDTVAKLLPITRGQPHPRYFPYPTSYKATNNEIINFRYLRSLQNYDTCVTYLGEIIEQHPSEHPPQVVVKFVSTYSQEVHRFLAEKGYAPTLRYYSPLPDCPPVQRLSPAEKSAPSQFRLSEHLVYMVVMDFVESKTYDKLSVDAQKNARAQLKVILRDLHCAGFVFGDLRPPNILITRDGHVNLIDFNWSGRFDMKFQTKDSRVPEDVRQGIQLAKERLDSDPHYEASEAYYPSGLSQEIQWANGVQALAPILPEHDWGMFDLLG
ncbi:hypothetical protein Clacol_000447 [Clathrus columnatus]|uniref:non-specific serine/threonine protein kinase n=1 Tax=Clathrus columnatus TaxID=1419009 RepID=A0AAV4ZWJ4_9AGAM|nr:hypothetical protein Clacol_000447 [Clathrus columnatus]